MSKAVDGHVWRAYVWLGKFRLKRLKCSRRGVDVFDTAEEALQAFIRLAQLDAENLEKRLAIKHEFIRQAEKELRALGLSDGGAK